MDLLNGHVLRLREAFQVLLFSHNRTGRCVVPLIVRSIHKSADQSAMARGVVLYAARLGHCRACPLRQQCQEAATTIKARRVSAVYWPVSANPSIAGESPPALRDPSPPSVPHPVRL